MALIVGDVTADPVLSFATTGPAGTALHALAYAGARSVVKEPKGSLFAGRGPVVLGFYVPGAGPFRASHLLTSWAEVSLAMTEIASGTNSTHRTYGADGVTVVMVDDGSGRQWPYLWVRVWGGERMLLRYRLTVTQPLER